MFKQIAMVAVVGFAAVAPAVGHDAQVTNDASVVTTETSAAESHATHDHGVEPTVAHVAWRYVTHYNCGYTGSYSVHVGYWNTIRCWSCGYWFRAYIPC